jgi:hypothetical protein
MMHPVLASALAREHRRDMIVQAGQAALARQITQATRHRHDMTVQAGQAILTDQITPATQAPHGSHAVPVRWRRAASGSRGPCRSAPRAYLAGTPFPRYRVSWSRTTLPSAAGGRRGRSWIIVISATRSL